MENNCQYVSSRGILKSCNIYSPNPISSSSTDKQYLIDMITNPSVLKPNMTIYVCGDLIPFFITKILPKIRTPFILVSGDSDVSIPYEYISKEYFNQLINSPYLIKWAIQNNVISHHKIITIPIGLDYHTILNNPTHPWKLPNEHRLPKSQEQVLQTMANSSAPFWERIPKIYVNFTVQNDRYHDRKESLNTIPKQLLIMNQTFTPRTINWKHILKYTFVLSPFGNGLDCHRTWEILCLGSIPVVKAPMFKELFKDLPVLNVDHWNQVTPNLLDQTIHEFNHKHKHNQFNYNKLTLQYWINQIQYQPLI